MLTPSQLLRIVLLITLLCVSHVVLAQEPVRYETEGTRLAIGGMVSILEDPSNELTVEEVAARSDFSPPPIAFRF